MPAPNPAALDFLLPRRSTSAKTLGLPVPDDAALDTILTAAARSPDHGKLEPWRFILLDRAALQAMSVKVTERATVLQIDPDQTVKSRDEYARSHLAVIVVSSPVASEKIPDSEQLFSAGAVCLSLLNAALASGWGANWLSGWASRDPEILTWLGVTSSESIAGIIHLGTESSTPPDRPRPDLAAITTRFRP